MTRHELVRRDLAQRWALSVDHAGAAGRGGSSRFGGFATSVPKPGSAGFRLERKRMGKAVTMAQVHRERDAGDARKPLPAVVLDHWHNLHSE
jgi:hypothetical protein